MKINKHLYKNSLFLSLPGIISIFLSLISIPFHIEIAGLKNYGNYLFFHFILSISFLLNMGLAKTLVIAINKNPTYKSQIIYEGLKYCFIICLLFVFIFFSVTLIRNNLYSSFRLYLLFILFILIFTEY